MSPLADRPRRALAEARAFLAGIEEHALFSHAAATGFFLFFAIPPALLVLVALVGMLPLERTAELLAGELRGWLHMLIEQALPPESSAVAVRLLENALAPWLARIEGLGAEGLRAMVQEFLDGHLPPAAAAALGALVGDVLERPRPGLLTVGSLAILWSASGATRAAMRALNAIYEVRRHSFLRRSVLSLVLTLAILLGASFTLTALPLGNAAAQAVVELFSLPAGVLGVWSTLNWAVGLAFMLGVVCVLLRYGPNVRQNLALVVPGAAVTVVAWVLLGMAMGAWTRLGWERTNATYGTLAAVIVLLLWCYLVSVAMLLGAEINAWLVARRGLAPRVVAGYALPHARRWPPLPPIPLGGALKLGRRARGARAAARAREAGEPGPSSDRTVSGSGRPPGRARP